MHTPRPSGYATESANTSSLVADDTPSFPVLSPEELVRTHIPIVHHMVSDLLRRVPQSVQREDLVSAGLLGLVQASRSYDPSRGITFLRFARTRVQGALMDELRSRDWASRSVRSRERSLTAASDELATHLGRPPTQVELSERLGVSATELNQLNEDVRRATMVKLDTRMLDVGAPRAVASTEGDPGELVTERETRAYVRDAVAALPERLRHVVVGYFLEDRPMQELADELGVTESRISQMRAEALSLIREAMTEHLADSAPDRGPVTGRSARRRAAYCAAVSAAADYRAAAAAAARAESAARARTA